MRVSPSGKASAFQADIQKLLKPATKTLPECLNSMVRGISGSMVGKFGLALRVSIKQFSNCAARVTVQAMEKLSWRFS